ncbi:UPF0225 protein [Thiosulfatimonas sediminis]|uniref:UPF0225 protein THMIRHAS_13470 n=1 Tax=Thiosulfatimonas sediminis TaxID=2675054 RepID=A0A6F8PVE1_9GAMM|nr:YchJ family metal-binding protein [Thiosulfatimonas sediminis]BBP45974.1 UPF0225 protein [Thiosulfatimonas sediminis]
MNEINLCPCNSGKLYVDCCQPLHLNAQNALTAEQLMRSRYCAFVLHDADYLLRTWHPRTRPQTIEFEKNIVWTGLNINGRKQGRKKDQQGWVTFVAHYRVVDLEEPPQTGHLHETSFFSRDSAGHWYYEDGQIK